MHLTPMEDTVNPNLGWIIPPLAIATEPVARAAAIDPSIPEVMYAVAALIYAIAALRKSTRHENSASKSTSIFSRKIKPTSRGTGENEIDDVS